MYQKIPNGEKLKIDSNAGYTVDVWLPEVGYGFNTLTGETEKTDVIKRSHNPKEQYWERIELPKNWKELRAKEKQKQVNNKDYFDPELEKIRERHWKYRLCGVWVYMNGKPVYITGEHYMYMTWWRLQDGFPEYRNCDRLRYYFQEFCVHDQRCAGIIESSNRRSGKSFRAGLFLENYVSMTEDAKGGLQSKTDIDAKNFFRNKIVTNFKRLPDFFQPEIDASAGVGMTKEIKFTTTTRKGKSALQNMDDLGLNSYLDYRASGEYSYDGEALQRVVHDEVGKPSDADVHERWGVVRYCLRVGKKWIGKALLTTTCEEIEGVDMEKHPFKKLWEESDYTVRDENGHTKSGLYRWFIPASETLEVDKYGVPKIAENTTYILNTRNGLKHDLKKWLAEIKKNALTVQEMFKSSATGQCHFNQFLLEEIDATLLADSNHLERGNIEWINGIPIGQAGFKGVHWLLSGNGKWYKRKDFRFPENAYEQRGSLYYPKLKLRFASACDPFQLDNTEDSRNSMGASHAKQRNWFTEEHMNQSYVLFYHARPKLVKMFHEDMMKQCLALGTDILIENAKDGGLIKTFENSPMKNFVQKIEGKENAGIHPNEDNRLIAVGLMYDFLESQAAFDYYKLLHRMNAHQLIIFNAHKTEKTDVAMSMLWCEMADYLKKAAVKPIQQTTDIGKYFRKYKAG